jgi:phosphatidylglycerophosphate synthase
MLAFSKFNVIDGMLARRTSRTKIGGANNPVFFIIIIKDEQ